MYYISDILHIIILYMYFTLVQFNYAVQNLTRMFVEKVESGHYLFIYLSIPYTKGRWVTTDDFTTSFLHSSLFSTALWDVANSRPIHSLMLSSLESGHIKKKKQKKAWSTFSYIVAIITKR